MSGPDLTGRHAYVTGGGSGIGAAIALLLAKQGARVTISGRRREPLDAMAGQVSGIDVVTHDVADEAATIDAMEAAATKAGPIDILIANAGIAETMPIAKADLAFWRRTMAINLDGAYVTMRAVVPAMKERGWGRIIAIASVAGQRGIPRGTAYCASKHGLIGLCRALAEETLGTGITVNALCPGYVRTPLVDRGVDNIVQKTGMAADAALKAMVDSNPGGRLIEPEEVADLALYLCADSNGAINGQAIQLAGGHV
ncbi:MAG: SDR family NAD(P)-dependent oxidoreductase [Pseudomonadota bacterium]